MGAYMNKNNILLPQIIIYLSFILSVICTIWVIAQGYIAGALEARLIPCSIVLGFSLLAIATLEK